MRQKMHLPLPRTMLEVVEVAVVVAEIAVVASVLQKTVRMIIFTKERLVNDIGSFPRQDDRS